MSNSSASLCLYLFAQRMRTGLRYNDNKTEQTVTSTVRNDDNPAIGEVLCDAVVQVPQSLASQNPCHLDPNFLDRHFGRDEIILFNVTLLGLFFLPSPEYVLGIHALFGRISCRHHSIVTHIPVAASANTLKRLTAAPPIPTAPSVSPHAFFLDVFSSRLESSSRSLSR